MSKKGYIYIITNQNNTTLYIGVTSNLIKRIYEHKNKLVDGFSKRYKLTKLVYFEEFEEIQSAIEREKYLKGKKRDFKNNLINAFNPGWNDLYGFICGDSSASPQNDGRCHPESSEGSQGKGQQIDSSGNALRMTGEACSC